MFAIADHYVQPRPVARMPPEARGKARLLRNYKLTCVQLDAMWTYVGHKGKKGTSR